MVLATKFNTNFKSPQTDDLMFGLIMTSTYGSNPFCFHKAAGFLTHANDTQRQSPEAPHTAILGL